MTTENEENTIESGAYKVYVLSFGCDGFEAIVDLSAIRKEQIAAKMKGIEDRYVQTPDQVASTIVIAARANEQRRVEVWGMNFPEPFTDEYIKWLAEHDTQYLADLVRENGTNIYKPYVSGRKPRIV